MTDHRRHDCIDCGASCTWGCYRCQTCSRTEAGTYHKATGKLLGRIVGPGELAKRTQNRLTRADQRIADVRANLDLGIEPGRIAADLGIGVDSLERFLQRVGAHDLVARIHGARWEIAA